MAEDQDQDQELTREGLLRSFVGKAKEAAGEIVGNEELAEAGRLEQSEAEELGDADTESSAAAQRDPRETP